MNECNNVQPRHIRLTTSKSFVRTSDAVDQLRKISVLRTTSISKGVEDILSVMIGVFIRLDFW